jgi:hypothetical protein
MELPRRALVSTRLSTHIVLGTSLDIDRTRGIHKGWSFGWLVNRGGSGSAATHSTTLKNVVGMGCFSQLQWKTVVHPVRGMLAAFSADRTGRTNNISGDSRPRKERFYTSGSFCRTQRIPLLLPFSNSPADPARIFYSGTCSSGIEEK